MSSPLGECVEALENGDWHRALRLNRYIANAPEVLDGDRSSVLLASCLDDVTQSMRQRTRGLVSARGGALERLDSAILILGQVGQVFEPLGRLILPSPPDPGARAGRPHLLWRAARLTVRERGELEHLRKYLKPLGKHETREFLVAAYVEHLTWISFDPWAWSAEHSPVHDLVRTSADYNRLVEFSRVEICRRATDLRHFAQPEAPDVSNHAWKNAEGHWRLLGTALRTLAEPTTDLAVPRQSRRGRPEIGPAAGPRTSGPTSEPMPVRLPLRRAREFAVQWRQDVESPDLSTDHS